MSTDDKAAKSLTADPPGEERKAPSYGWVSALLTRLGLQVAPPCAIRSKTRSSLEAMQNRISAPKSARC